MVAPSPSSFSTPWTPRGGGGEVGGRGERARGEGGQGGGKSDGGDRPVEAAGRQDQPHHPPQPYLLVVPCQGCRLEEEGKEEEKEEEEEKAQEDTLAIMLTCEVQFRSCSSTVVIGESGSSGALGIAMGNSVGMFHWVTMVIFLLMVRLPSSIRLFLPVVA